MLPSPGKVYRNLTIHHWDHAAGMEAHRSPANLERFAVAAALAVKEVPAGELVLIVHRLAEEGKGYRNLQRRILERVRATGGGPERVRFLTWGRHTASNAYADIGNVIVIGLHQYSMAANEAGFRASARTFVADAVSDEQVHEFRLGEVKHHLFQAVGRGATRKCVAGGVPPGCRLWCVFSTNGRMGVPRKLLEEVFPGAPVHTWEPLGTQLRGGKMKSDGRARFVAEVMRRVEAAGGQPVAFGCRDFPEFDHQAVRRYMSHPVVLKVLDEKGVGVKKAGVPRRGGQADLWTLVGRSVSRSPIDRVGEVEALSAAREQAAWPTFPPPSLAVGTTG
jgi:hypothetical protein